MSQTGTPTEAERLEAQTTALAEEKATRFEATRIMKGTQGKNAQGGTQPAEQKQNTTITSPEKAGGDNSDLLDQLLTQDDLDSTSTTQYNTETDAKAAAQKKANLTNQLLTTQQTNEKQNIEQSKFIEALHYAVKKKLHELLRTDYDPNQNLEDNVRKSLNTDLTTTLYKVTGIANPSQTAHNNDDGAWDNDAYDLVNQASDAGSPNKEETERLLREFGNALDQANGTEGKFSGDINKAMNTHLLSKTVGASAVLTFVAPILAASGPGDFDLASFTQIFTQDNSGEMFTALVIIVMLALILRMLENSLKKDDKEAATDLKSEIKAQLTKIATGEAIDNESIAALKGKFQELNALCSNGAGMTGKFEPLINNLIETGIKNNIILNDKAGLAKSEKQVSGIMKRGVQAALNGKGDIKKTKNSIIQMQNADATRKAPAISDENGTSIKKRVAAQ